MAQDMDMAKRYCSPEPANERANRMSIAFFLGVEVTSQGEMVRKMKENVKCDDE